MTASCAPSSTCAGTAARSRARGEGRRETLQCPYHAWTYDLDGSLRAAPRADREPGFSTEGLGLLPVAIETWGPFVFVSPDPGESLADTLGDVPEQLAAGGVNVDALRFHHRAESTYEANWKLCAENYLECYHCAVAHHGFSRVIDVSPDAYGLRTGRWTMSQTGDARDGAGNRVAHGQFHFVFPNTAINVMPGEPNLSIGPIVPRTAERTWRSLDYFFAPDADEGWIADFLSLDDQVGREDTVLVERVQQGVRAGAIAHGHALPRSEQLVVHFDRLLRESIGASGTPGRLVAAEQHGPRDRVHAEALAHLVEHRVERRPIAIQGQRELVVDRPGWRR